MARDRGVGYFFDCDAGAGECAVSQDVVNWLVLL